MLSWLAACDTQRRSRMCCPVVVDGTGEKKKTVISIEKNVVVEYLQMSMRAFTTKIVLSASVRVTFRSYFGSERLYMSKAIHTKRARLVNIWKKFK